MLDCFYSGVTSCVDPDCRKSLKVPHQRLQSTVLVAALLAVQQ